MATKIDAKWSFPKPPSVLRHRRLLPYPLHFCRYEVFMTVDGGTDGITAEDDHRISRDEFLAALPRIVEAGRTWANSLAFANATAESFEQMDQNRGGIIDLQEFCEWAESAEKLTHTAQGADLGVNEPIDRPAHGAVGASRFKPAPQWAPRFDFIPSFFG